MFFFWESKIQLIFMYFSSIQKGWNLQDFKFARLLKNWCKFFDLGFSKALTTPQTAIPILKPSEGVSLRSVIMSFRLIMEAIHLGRLWLFLVIWNWLRALSVGSVCLQTFSVGFRRTTFSQLQFSRLRKSKLNDIWFWVLICIATWLHVKHDLGR